MKRLRGDDFARIFSEINKTKGKRSARNEMKNFDAYRGRVGGALILLLICA